MLIIFFINSINYIPSKFSMYLMWLIYKFMKYGVCDYLENKLFVL